MITVIRDKILGHLVGEHLSTSGLTWREPKYGKLTILQGSEWVPMVIVGNKSDLRPEQRQVTPESGKKLSDEFNCAWTEASARYNENVTKAFELIIGQIEKSQNPNEPTGGNKCEVM